MLSKAYTSQLRETELNNLTVTGEIPSGLWGSFISNGPAQFEVGSTHFNHWFDGFAMLKKFEFNAGKVSFQNKFLRSQQYINSTKNNKLNTNEFGTYASSSLIGRIKNAIHNLKASGHYDNCNVNISCIDNHFVALTESADIIEFNPADLSTIGAFAFNDCLRGQTQLAHPQVDRKTGEIINVLTEFGKEIKYHIYKIAPNSTRREIIKTYISKMPFYMHSFSITENYVILFKSPLVMNVFKLMLGLPFNNCVSWKKNACSYFIVIDRRDGSVREIDTEAFLCLHSANAYEHNDELVLDLICYDTLGNPYPELSIHNLSAEQPKLSHGFLQRYFINLKTKQCRKEQLAPDSMEFPRAYDNFLYTTVMTDRNQKFFNALQKNNLQNGATQRFEKAGYYFGEPVLADGIVLSLAFNTQTQCSALMILDAQDMQQRAEISLPFHLPFGLHGDFVSRTKSNDTQANAKYTGNTINA